MNIPPKAQKHLKDNRFIDISIMQYLVMKEIKQKDGKIINGRLIKTQDVDADTGKPKEVAVAESDLRKLIKMGLLMRVPGSRWDLILSPEGEKVGIQ